MGKIALSVITVNLNNAAGLRKTLESVTGQSARSKFEFVVVDGASTDGSTEVLQEYADRIDKWVSEPDKGIYNAMNKGVAMASGTYCIFINSGDTFHENRTLEDSLGLLHEDLVLGAVQLMDSDIIREAPEPLTLAGLFDKSIPHNAAFIKTDLLRKHPYDENWKIISDWKFFLQAIIFDNVSCRSIDTVICDYDRNGISSVNRDLREFERQEVLRELFPERILADYYQSKFGAGNTGTLYDRFQVKLKDYRSSRWLYTLNVLLLRALALFKKSARWARLFPLTLPEDNH